MANVTTTPTVADHLTSPGNASLVVRTDRNLFCIVRTATDTLTLYRTTDTNATAWTSVGSFTHTGLQEWSSLTVDPFGWAHIAYRIGTASYDTIWYRRLNTGSSAPAWGTPLQVSTNDANGGVIGATWQGLDMAVVRNPNGSYAIVIAGARNTGTTKYGCLAYGVSITAGGEVYNNNAIISGNRLWMTTGTPPGRSGVQVEVEHSGTGYVSTGATTNVWIAWGRSSLRMVKLTWKGSSSGWSGPTSAVTVRSSLPYAQDYLAARWDGKWWVMAAISPDDQTKLRLYQRNQSNTSTVPLVDTQAHPQGNIRYVSLSYDYRNQNPRAYAVGTSNNVLYYCDYTRSNGVWTAWATVTATAIANTGQEFSAAKGGTAFAARYQLVTGHNTVSPYTVTHQSQAPLTAPAVATWDFSTAPYSNGSAADVNGLLSLAWTFSDDDPGQVQGSYALARTIGASATQYWNATTSSWSASEVQNSSSTTGVNLPSGWGAGTDANHVYQVKVWDNTNTPAPAYSAPLQLTPSAKVNPTMTAPTAGGTVAQDTVTVTWTAAEQTAWQVQLLEAGTFRLLYDTGKQVGADTSFTVPVSLTSGSQYIAYVWTFNLEGLMSNSANATFTASYAPPVAVLAVPSANTALGVITVASAGPASVGAQPAIAGQDLYRRVKSSTALNSAVASFSGSVTGWSAASGTLSYSTAQSVSSPGAARVVPDGTSGDARFRLATPIDMSADIAAGRSFEVSGWLRPDTANKPMIIRADFYNASNSLVGSATSTFTNVVAGAWHFLQGAANPLALGFTTATKVSVSIGLSTTPAVGDAFYADDVTVRLGNDDPGVRVASLVAAGGTVNDWGPAAGVDYEYRWRSVGANGGSLYGPWNG